ncbi:MAG: carboxypeptidase regulatory-like domain-containing protein, partial [Cytophagaceae bacterium]
MRYCMIRYSFTLIFILVSTLTWAQVTTSGLTGRITDAKKESLIGATVQALYTPTGARYATVTDAEGRYRINNMNAGGPYEITYSYVSFKTTTRSGVTLQ